MPKRNIDNEMYYKIISESLYYTATNDSDGYISCESYNLYNLLRESTNLELFINKINLENAEIIIVALDKTLSHYYNDNNIKNEIDRTKKYICITFSLKYKTNS